MPSRSKWAITRSRAAFVRQLHDVDEPRAHVVGVVGERHLDAVDVAQELAVPRRDLAPQAQDLVELLELPDPERRAHIVEAVVEAEPHVLEPAAVVAATLVAQRPQQPPLLLRVRRDHPALAGRDLLVRIEREHGARPVRADRRALVLGAERLARVLHEREPVLVARSRAARRARMDSRRCRPRRSPSSAT